MKKKKKKKNNPTLPRVLVYDFNKQIFWLDHYKRADVKGITDFLNELLSGRIEFNREGNICFSNLKKRKKN